MFLLSLPFTVFGQDQSYQQLRQGFKNPPQQAMPKTYWWWLNGNVDTLRLREELRAMKKAGIAGVDIFEIGVPPYNNPNGMVKAGPLFMGPESLDAIVFAIREATRLHIDVGLNVASSWNAGGSWIKPQYAAKSIYQSKTTVEGSGSPQKLTLPFPEIPKTDAKGKPLLIEFGADGKPVFHQEIAVVALPVRSGKPHLDTSQVRVLSAQFDAKSGLLSWNVPSGKWEVYRYVCANSGEPLKLPSPNSVGPIIDHFDSSATRFHFQYFIDRLKPRLGDFSMTALKGLYLASYEATGFVWTPTLPATFRQLNGYAIDKFLPALFDKTLLSAEQRTDFQQGYNRTLSELMINNHYRKAKEIANHYGLKITSEAGGPGPPLHNVPVETLKALGSLDIPRGEFWNRYQYLDADSVDIMCLVKEIAAAAHIYKRPIIEEEAFTSFHHWQEGPFDLKPIADRAFGEGMNRVVIHGFSHNPTGTGFPGIVYGAGTHMNDKQTWWPKIKPFMEYLGRMSYILQHTAFIADVVYYYGDKVPNFAAPKNTRFTVGPGYDYEIINTDILLHDLTVKGGQLTLSNGARFRVLVLDATDKLPPAVMDKLHLLQKQGAVISGPSFSGDSPLALLKKQSLVPDFTPPAPAVRFDYVHYRQQDTDFYLVTNTGAEWTTGRFSFRQIGKTPELWDPVSGAVTPISIYEQESVQLSLPLSLPPYGAYWVVFRKSPATPHFTQFRTPTQPIPPFSYTDAGVQFWQSGAVELTGKGKTPMRIKTEVSIERVSGPWQLRFPKGWGAPESVTLPQLISWSESERPGILYFSGTGTYKKTVSLTNSSGISPNERVYLNLGRLSEVADVWLNDRHLGISWAEPHRFDITDVVSHGDNKLRIEVANAWSNRITGDALTGETFTHTNISIGFRGTPWRQVPLLESGLLGPVTIQTIKTTR